MREIGLLDIHLNRLLRETVKLVRSLRQLERYGGVDRGCAYANSADVHNKTTPQEPRYSNHSLGPSFYLFDHTPTWSHQTTHMCLSCPLNPIWVQVEHVTQCDPEKIAESLESDRTLYSVGDLLGAGLSHLASAHQFGIALIPVCVIACC